MVSSNVMTGARSLPVAFTKRTVTDIGLIALATDHAIESELRLILPAQSVALHANRIPCSNQFDLTSLAAMAGEITAASANLLPETRLPVIAYGCTSGTVAAGEGNILDHLKRVRPGAAPTTPITAALAAFRVLNAKRVAVLTPYSRPVHDAVARFLVAAGIELTDSTYLGVDRDNRITEISGETLASAVKELARSDCDAVFLSCTALTVVGSIAALERLCGKPIVTSNQALAWHCMRLANLELRAPGYGKLLAA